MAGILNIGTRALQANQIALQTAGNNIANVNTAGYSRQSVVLQTVEGQYSGGGYIGNGVAVQTIQRNFDAFLTRQSALAGSTQAADTTRAEKLQQLGGLFQGGATGLGASINDMLNAFSDVASAPTDLTARSVVLTRLDETAARMRSTSQQLDDLQLTVTQELTQKVASINSLAKSIAKVNGEIAIANGNGQPPNDLLDRRDQLVRDLNKLVQTTSIPADDGTVGIFVGGGQALVLGTNASPVALVADEFGQKSTKLAITASGYSCTLDENALGGGAVSGLLRFQNTDLAEGRNLLGRLTTTVTDAINTQNRLGIDLDGSAGKDLLTPITSASFTVLAPTAQAHTGASLTLSINDATKFAASDYEVSFTAATTGSITRRSDGLVTAFSGTPITIDGLSIAVGAASAGDRFLLKPFSSSASNITSQIATPRSLAVASPVVGSTGTSNTGSLQQTSLIARNNPPSNTPLTLTFNGAGGYTRSDDPALSTLPPTAPVVYPYVAGQAIESALVPTTPMTGWSVTMQGAPKAGDTYTVGNTMTLSAAGKIDYKLNAGNATAMMALRDKATFDGATLSDGYAGLIAQVGIRGQGANYAAEVSTSIAANLEAARTGVSGVNLDEEAAKLLQYQQAYQACAKMISISQNIFDTLLQGMR